MIKSRDIYLAAFFFFFFFFLASPSSSSAGASSTGAGAGSSALGSSLTATKRPIISFDLINLKFAKDIINLSLGHLVSPGHESMLEHLGVNLALLIVSLESLNDEVIRVISISSHLLLEHLDHVVIGASTSDLTKETIKFSLTHEDTNVVKSTTEVIFINGTILVDVHKLEAVLVHLELLLGESAFILSLAHFGYELLLLPGSSSRCP